MRDLLFVTGPSCSGKTTLGEAILRDIDLPWVTVHDLDADAPARPTTAWLDWLRWQAAEQLAEADRDATEGRYGLRVVTGIVWPFRVIESPAWASAVANPQLTVRWWLLHPPVKVLLGRLRERTAGKSRGERAELVRYNRELRTGLRHQVDAVRGGTVHRTTDLTELTRRAQLAARALTL
jgi:hypothetical protein